MAKTINYFKDQDIPYAEMPADDNSRFGSDIMRDSKEIQVGAGNTVFRANESGIWLGSAKWSTAPFRVDMLGNLTANSVTLSGYIAVGGAAADVNGNTTTISGGKITTGSITALQIAAGTITTNKLAFTPVDSTNVVASINASTEGIQITGARVSINGSTTFASGYNPSLKLNTADAGDLAYLDLVEKAKLGTTVISGGYILTSLLTASNIQTGTLNASLVNVTNLNASNITSGTINVGGTNQPTAIIIAASTITGNSRLGFQNGSRIWESNTASMGYNAIGGTMIFYGNSTQMVQFTTGSQAIFYDGISCRGAFNVGVPNGTSQNARFTATVYFDPTNSTTQSISGSSGNMNYNAQTYHYWNVAGSERAKLSTAGLTLQGYLYQPNDTRIYLGGYSLNLTSNKTAIVPTSNGFNALYCTESPEVWFMDFAKDKNSLDPLFKEVTTSPYHYIRCEDGEYQVWGKRKGHEKYRFESKTEEEFRANEKFLNMNKPLLARS